MSRRGLFCRADGCEVSFMPEQDTIGGIGAVAVERDAHEISQHDYHHVPLEAPGARPFGTLGARARGGTYQ